MDIRDDQPIWRSLAQFEAGPEAEAPTMREFAPGDLEPPQVDRRRFLQLLGASAGLAGATSCRWQESKILPFAHRPEGRVPGVPEYYATQMELGGVAQPLLVTAFDGRPIKVEGNPEHPLSAGSATMQAQAAILEVYDPDRAKNVRRRENGDWANSVWSTFENALSQRLQALSANGGAGLAVLCEASSSPALARLRRMAEERWPDMRWFEVDGLSRDTEREGARLAFGTALRTHYRLDGARVIAAFDADLFGAHPDAQRHSREFALHRRPEAGPMNRLYALEANLSNTGASADHRLPARGERIGLLLAALEAKVVELGRMSVDSTWGTPAEHPGGEYLATPKVARFVEELAKDLLANRGASLVAVGPDQPAPVHARAHRLNALLGNVGATLRYTADPGGERPTHGSALEDFARALGAGEVDTLLILGGNPVYTSPDHLGLAERLEAVPFSAHLTLYENETSVRCQWQLPRAHWLECWGDGLAWDGSYSVAQPLILPLYGGRSPLELLAAALGESLEERWEPVRAAFAELIGDEGNNYDIRWRRTLHDGMLADSAAPVVTPTPRALPAETFPERVLSAADPGREAFELHLALDPKMLDGRFLNSGWLQELPEFLTKLTWDNALLLAPSSAKELGLAYEDTVDLEIDGRRLSGVAVYPMPGHARGSATLYLGWGRTLAGRVGGLPTDGVAVTGFDGYRLMGPGGQAYQSGLSISRRTGRYPLACTQDHFQMDATGGGELQDRVQNHIVRSADLTDFERNPEFAKAIMPPLRQTGPDGETKLVPAPYPPLVSLWKEFTYEGHKWGMSIDMGACTGCNACVIACQSENNIPIVGKDQVRNHREMHWLRIDRYFVGDDADEPEVRSQPVACTHCEMAPCEQVCPVAATVHSDEGLNDMIYNRCVGTRYCSNNCPLKVRKFNYFNYHRDLREERNQVKRMALNPEVTVRMRGVMEKCTYCVQRIQAAKIKAGNERRMVRDGEVVTACQQTCPADAIRFGDLNDAGSRVAEAHASPRSYGILEYLNIKPRTLYLARIRNPNPALEGRSA